MDVSKPDLLRWEPGKDVNDLILAVIVQAIARQQSSNHVQSKTELDSHANMPVVGKHAYVLAELGKQVSVSPFTPDYEAMTIEMVDAAVQ